MDNRISVLILPDSSVPSSNEQLSLLGFPVHWVSMETGVGDWVKIIIAIGRHVSRALRITAVQ